MNIEEEKSQREEHQDDDTDKQSSRVTNSEYPFDKDYHQARATNAEFPFAEEPESTGRDSSRENKVNRESDDTTSEEHHDPEFFLDKEQIARIAEVQRANELENGLFASEHERIRVEDNELTDEEER
ncbi:hypothetical protein LGQ02_03675 [Bacillus shivajii]|uniref:hypothetical protein n=1 Tax=Bacillus shivajii TaxID=1983719 RepID=UPI001CFB5563|nr:hypothetical protein [Bacillus shivajii]UCZ53895.1 hypothetical protein LGQ02_03675 [Bacillus shivajii]